jgi:hypothetical protein
MSSVLISWAFSQSCMQAAIESFQDKVRNV